MDDPLERKNTDGKFYVGLTILVTVIIVGVAAMVIHQRGGIYGPPPPNVEDLRRDRMAAPGHNDDYILDYAAEVMAASVTFDARTFHNQLADLEGYFTPDGWTLFNHTLERLEVVQMMQSGRFTVTPSLNGDPVIIGKGVEAATYQWRVAVPLMVVMESSDRSLDRGLVAHARIIRRPLEQYPQGIAIDSLNFLPDESAVPGPG